MSHAVIHADALTYLRGNRWLVQNDYLPRAHAVLCDPPYGLEFMGKEWDKPKPSGLMATRGRYTERNDRNGNVESSPFLAAAVNKYVAGEDFQAWVTEWAGLLIDYVYPGAVGLFFGGTRTYHRLAAGLEDAGWEITDSMCVWVHAQGFPKSASIGKLLDKEAGAAREVVGNGKAGRSALSDKAGKEYGYRPNTYRSDDGTFDITAPATPLAARWEGYGTALKPAYEPIVIARAPRGKRTYAALAREFGTGALAIDAARIGTDERTYASTAIVGAGRERAANVIDRGDGKTLDGRDYQAVLARQAHYSANRFETTVSGRWPANFGLVCACEGDDHADDCPVSVLGRQSGVSTTPTKVTRGVNSNDSTFRLYEYTKYEVDSYGDTGTAARFFYQAKAAAWERHWPVKSNHPTVKPIRLAEYLARLILPPELDTPRRLLVPFAGSGSEMIGARLAGWDVVTGIERESEYVALAEARLAWWAQFASYDDARAAYEKERKAKPALVVIEDKPEQIALFPADEEAS